MEFLATRSGAAKEFRSPRRVDIACAAHKPWRIECPCLGLEFSVHMRGQARSI